MKAIAIVLMCILAAVLYGILHDEITARICVEYFTVGHPNLFRTDSPTLLGIGWGVVATWWVGLFLGVSVALAATFGRRPRVEPAALVRPIGRLLLVMGACAVMAGLLGFMAARLHWVYLMEGMAARVPASRHVAFLVALWMHSASYLTGLVGGLLLVRSTWRRRVVPAPPEPFIHPEAPYANRSLPI